MKKLQASQTVTVLIGPFLDDVSAVPETALTINASDVLLSKNGAATGAKAESSAATHRAQGFYAVTLNAADTDTVGILDVIVKISGAMVVHNYFEIQQAAKFTADRTAPGASGGYPTTDASNRIAGIQGTLANTFDALLDFAVEDQPSTKLRDAMAYILAHAVGVSTGMSTSSGTLKSPNGAESRAVATLDGLGNRSAVTLTAPT